MSAAVHEYLNKLRDVTGRDVFLYASDNPSVPEGFTRGGRDYAKDNGVHTVFHAAHENAHNMPRVLNAISALMDDDVITEADFREYMRVRVQNIATKRGGRPGMLSQQQSKTEFACDLFGAVMYAAATGDVAVYERIGVSGDMIQQVESAIQNALAYDPEIEHDMDVELRENDAACGNEEAVEFSDVDIKNALGGTLTDENVTFLRSIYNWDGKDHRGFFRVGMPSDALLSIGVPNVAIHLDQSKAVKIIEKHPEMGNFIFWAIPEAINDPIVIAESTDNSFIVLGEASFNGHPVSIVMRMKSTQRGTATIETCKVRSSYVMNDSSISKVLGSDGENIVYLNEDKNRTDAWFQAGGQPLRAPLGGSKFGSIRRLSYADVESNTPAENSQSDGSRSYLDVDTDAPITREVVAAVQSIGRKSVNSFTSEDIKKAEPFARRYWKEMGVKSPFFRAWFGDWRAHDQTSVTVTEVSSETIDPTDVPRGEMKNADTGWGIVSGRDGIDETANKEGKASVAYHSLSDIGKLIQSAVLLDTQSVSEPSKRMGQDAVFTHTLYTVARSRDAAENSLFKITVAEYRENNSTKKKFYLLRTMKMPLGGVGPAANTDTRISNPNAASSGIITVSDLFALVKQFDKTFEPNPVHPALLNEDGTPKVVYHGTDGDFSAFDMSKGRANMDIQGAFFSPWEDDARGYGKNVRAFYLSIRNPASEQTAYKALRMFQGQNEAGKKARQWLESQGYDGVNNEDEEYIAFYPEQIKSATDNIGTFDAREGDIRCSENPLTESPEMREAMDKARTLFEDGVHYLAYYNQEGADNGVAKFLRGLWDSASRIDDKTVHSVGMKKLDAVGSANYNTETCEYYIAASTAGEPPILVIA